MDDPRDLLPRLGQALDAREAADLGPHACRSRDGRRAAAESPGAHLTRGDEPAAGLSSLLRPAFAHDADRILHSRAYTRYIDKTQVFSLFENDNITHRVLHVQLVARIARSIARVLRLNPDLVEAIALGHDLGHAPYGHDGESHLHSFAQRHGVGCFRHAAQSVRALRHLEAGGRGLNLCLQTLDGILAHNGELLCQEYRPRYGKTWDEFAADLAACFADPDHGARVLPMTLEGCVVRISDVIAYIGRDVEDAILLGVIRREQLPLSLTRVLGDRNDAIIDTLVCDLVLHSHGHDHLAFSPRVFAALRELLEFNYRSIYLDPRIKRESGKVARMFDLLSEVLLADLAGPDADSPITAFVADLPPSYREQTAPARIVVDFLAGMTDDYFNHLFRQRFVPQGFGYRLGDPGR